MLPGWADLPVRGGTSVRPDNLGWDDPACGPARANFLEELGISLEDLVLPQQAHGARVAVVGRRDRGRGARDRAGAVLETDALATHVPSVAVGIQTADCLPIFFFDPRHEVVAIAHAGWRGTAAGIAAEVLRVLAQRFKTDPSEVWTAIGPGIRACCYEVKEDVASRFKGAVQERGGRLYADLAEANRHLLREAGVTPQRIVDCELCTACESERFFSYRREGSRAGRMLSVIALGNS